MGVLDENTVFPCAGGFHYKGVTIKDMEGCSSYPSIQVSSNCYFSYAYQSILNKYTGNPSKGIDEWYKIMESFGLNAYMDNDLAVGAKGFIPDSKYYKNGMAKLETYSGRL